MQFEIVTTTVIFTTLQAEWLHLLSKLSFQSVFFTPQWHATWWQHFGNGRELRLVTVRSESGQLVGLAPLMLEASEGNVQTLSLIGDLDLCDYLDVLIDPAYQDSVVPLLGEVFMTFMDGETELRLLNLSPSSPTLQQLSPYLTEHGLTVEVEPIETCPTLELPADWETYLAALRSKDRHELRRKLRRAEQTVKLAYHVTTESAQLDADLETFIALHRMSQQPDKHDFMTPTKAAFFRDMVYQLWPQGWLELAFLHADDTPVAALCCFAYGGTYAAYNSGYHPHFSDLSVGILLFAERIRQAIGRRFIAFDFMRGNEAYKYRFGALDRPLSQLRARTACPV